MKSFLFASLIGLFSGSAIAQVSKKVVVEHFTNSKCGVCAGQNPSFNTNLVANPGVVRISYHPTSPYSSCVFAAHNPSENDARTNFYGIYGSTPRLAIMGSPISNSPNPYQNPNLYNTYQGQTSPYSLRIYQQKDADSIRVRCVLTSIGQPEAGQLRIYSAVAEDTIFQTTPNGEARHYNVFRKTFFGPNGQTFSPPAQGDSLVWEGKMAKNQAWNFNRIFAYALVQNVANRALQQSDFAKPADQTLTSNSDLLSRSGIEIFPNPSADWVSIRLKEKSNLKAELLDVQGKRLKSISSTGTEEVSFSIEKPGVYFLKMEVNGKMVSRKIIRK